MGDKKVELWDSLPGAKYNASRYQLAERIMKVLDYIYKDEIVKHFDKGWQFAKFNIVRTDKARRQLNGCDCGIFVMNWLEDIECTSHGSNKFQHASERVRVALSLLKNPKNKRLKEVRESARRVVDEELDMLAQHGPSIPHHPIARKPMTRSQAK
ncbi:PREDICTED: POPTR_0047s00210g [Prunus dulcis]|nr:PREDICTED: POPTR_0047s00210g [Prunus dulcis]